MRILVHHRTASRDGQAVHIHEMADALRRRGHEILIVGPYELPMTNFGGEVRGISTFRDKMPTWISEMLELAYSAYAFGRLVKSTLCFRPDVIYERYNLHLLAGVPLRRLAGIPLILEVNAPLFEERSRFGGLIFRALARTSQRFVWRGADIVLPVTHVLAEHVRSYGVPADRVIVMPNGIDPRRFLINLDSEREKDRLGLSGRFVLGFVGFIREWHGLQHVLQIIKNIGDPSIVFLVVGDGPAREELESKAQSLGLSGCLKVTGVLPREHIPGRVAAFDIALQPAVTEYASPLKLFEYMALGRAVVAPRSPNIEEILTDGENALLFPPGDFAAFEERILRLYRDDALRRRLGAAARRRVVEGGYSWDENARRLEALFLKTLARRGRAPLPASRRP